MEVKQVFEAAPGTVLLLYCEETHFEKMVNSIQSSIPDKINERSSLNTGPLIFMEMTADEKPNSFHDLAVLCSRLITTAGKRSHFEGVLLLNIENLIFRSDGYERLQALGEILAMEDGLTSRCITLICGPTDERSVLTAANALDFNGQLKVERIEFEEGQVSLRQLLKDANLKITTKVTSQLLQSTIDEMRNECQFDFQRFIQSCRPQNGVITEEGIQTVLNDPFSYVNRFKKTKALKQKRNIPQVSKKIGFQYDY